MRQQLTRVLSLSSIYSFGSLAQSAAAVLLLPLYTRYLTPADYGILALLDLTILMIAKLVEPPLTNALNRFYYKPDYRERGGVLLFNLTLVLAAVVAGLALAYWLSTDLLVGWLFAGEAALRGVVRLYTALLVLECVSAFLLTYLRLREHARYFVFLSLSKLGLSVGLIVYLLAARGLGLAGIVYGQIAGLVYLTVMILPLMLRNMTFRPSLAIVREPLKFGVPMVISGYSNLLLQSGDRYLLNLFTSVGAVGLYAFGYKLASVLNVALIVPVNQAIFPTIYQAEGRPAEQKRFIAATATYFYATAMFMALGVSLLAKELIRLLATQPEYWAAWPVVPLIAFSYVQLGLGRFFKWGALLRNQTLALALQVLASAALNFGLCLVLIPAWGILGAAVATVAAYLAWNALLLYNCRKYYDLHFELGRLGHLTVVGVGLYLPSLFIPELGTWLAPAAMRLGLLAAYPLVLWLTGFLAMEERSHLRAISLRAFARLRPR